MEQTRRLFCQILFPLPKLFGPDSMVERPFGFFFCLKKKSVPVATSAPFEICDVGIPQTPLSPKRVSTIVIRASRLSFAASVTGFAFGKYPFYTPCLVHAPQSAFQEGDDHFHATFHFF
jgi:hypothetical protein